MKLDATTLLDIKELMEKCKNELDSERRLKILVLINSMLPYTKQLHVPSYLTDDYIDRALYEIEKALKSYY
jgi:hypothetical protein